MLILSTSNLFSQVKFEDYRDGAEFTHFGTTYRVQNEIEHRIEIVVKNNIESYRMSVGLQSVDNQLYEHTAQYVDGTYTNNPDDMADIIIPKESYRRVLRHAMRNAFSIAELQSHPKELILMDVIVDNQGNILETSTGFWVSISYTPQPKQIAALETMIRKNLKFELDQEKASKFNYFEGMIWLYFGKYMNELPEGMVEEPTDDLYTIHVAVNEIGSFTPSLGSGSGPLRP